jgi:hypothetical protein
MNARAVAAWSACCLFVVLSTTNPVYKLMVLAAALSALAAGAGLRRIRGLLVAVLLISAFAILLNFVSAHLGTTVLFELPAQIPALGGPLYAGGPRLRRHRRDHDLGGDPGRRPVLASAGLT